MRKVEIELQNLSIMRKMQNKNIAIEDNANTPTIGEINNSELRTIEIEPQGGNYKKPKKKLKK